MARLGQAFLALTLLAGAAGCAFYGTYPEPVERPPYYYDYYYYPHANVYFQLYTGDYWYRHDRTWIRARVLPPGIYLDGGDRVTLHIRDPRPYERRPDYRAQRNYRYEPSRERDQRARDFNAQRHEEYRQRYGH